MGNYNDLVRNLGCSKEVLIGWEFIAEVCCDVISLKYFSQSLNKSLWSGHNLTNMKMLVSLSLCYTYFKFVEASNCHNISANARDICPFYNSSNDDHRGNTKTFKCYFRSTVHHLHGFLLVQHYFRYVCLIIWFCPAKTYVFQFFKIVNIFLFPKLFHGHSTWPAPIFQNIYVCKDWLLHHHHLSLHRHLFTHLRQVLSSIHRSCCLQVLLHNHRDNQLCTNHKLLLLLLRHHNQ